MTRPNRPEDFWARVATAAIGCWEWQGKSVQTSGYGQLNYGGTRRLAHRLAYELAVGPVPEGLVLDHLCRNRLCVNPMHLEPVTNRENLRRGEGWAGRNARKTHCDRGHELTADNVKVRPSRNGRECRACAADYAIGRRKAVAA